MISAPRSARCVVIAPGPSIELSMMRTPCSGGWLAMPGGVSSIPDGPSECMFARPLLPNPLRYPRTVLVDVGPVPSSSARAWIDYARSILRGLDTSGDGVDAEVGPDVVDAFRRYLDDWYRTARRNREFRWVVEIEEERAEYL